LNFGERGVRNGEFKTPFDVATNRQGHMYVTDRTNNKVQVFDRFGAFLSEFGAKGSKAGQFQGPEGIAIDQSGMVFVVDSENHRIQMFNADGTFHSKFGVKGKSNEFLNLQSVCLLMIQIFHIILHVVCMIESITYIDGSNK